MIRRSLPLDEKPREWLLISQIEHAELSWFFARNWASLLPSAPREAREEFLAAIRHHDDGWVEWEKAPKLDSEHHRPYGFTEMPPRDAQQIWTSSIDACRAIGPLAGWVVASHFIALQDKADDDFDQWRDWLEQEDERRSAWLATWLDNAPQHSRKLADECLHLLQTFDWLSLWFCCRAPIAPGEPREALELGAAESDFGVYRFSPDQDKRGQATPPSIRIDPWPFNRDSVGVMLSASRAPARQYASTTELFDGSVRERISWPLYPAKDV